MFVLKEFFNNLWDSDSLPVPWHFRHLSSFHGWFFILSDLMICAACLTIFFIILNYVYRRKTNRFQKAYLFFAFFILALGLTHLSDAVMFWFPFYRINALLRLVTACLGWLSFYHLFKLLPKFSTLKTSHQLNHELIQNENLLKAFEKSNHELKKQNAFIENILNSTLDHVNVYDTDLNLISVNAVTENLLNKSKYDLLGKNFTELFPGYVHTDYFLDLKMSALGHTIKNKLIKTAINRCYDTSFIPLFENEKQYAVLVIARDTTEYFNKEDSLIKLNEQLNLKNMQLMTVNGELEHFSNLLSHDLQEPLRKIKVYSELISDKLSVGLEKNSFKKIMQSADRMKHLIHNALDYVKTGNADVAFEKVDLEQLLAATLIDLDLKISEKNAHIKTDTLPEVPGIKYQLGQVFYNIISNALKYNTALPEIDILCKALTKKENGRENHFFEISFKDNGIGFDEKYKTDIFSPFTRLQSRAEFEGSGLGLALVKKIIDNHCGFIDVESQIGVGSVFKILLPAQQTRSIYAN
jgi:signal transduction histidine kinase